MERGCRTPETNSTERQLHLDYKSDERTDAQAADHSCPEVSNRMRELEHLERAGVLGAGDTTQRGRESPRSLDDSSLIIIDNR